MSQKTSDRFDRRTVLKMGGVTAVVALAGCTGADGEDTGDDTDEHMGDDTNDSMDDGMGDDTDDEEVEFVIETISTGDPFADTKTAADHVEGSAKTLAGGFAAALDLNGNSDSEAAELRATMAGLLQEHVYLAGYTVDAAYSFGPESGEFELAAEALDTNSVALADVIGDAAGDDNRAAFLSLWRDHIGFFVDYAVATAENDEQGQANAIRDLEGYTESAGGFFENISAGELPADAIADSLRDHIATLGGAIDSLDGAIN